MNPSQISSRDYIFPNIQDLPVLHNVALQRDSLACIQIHDFDGGIHAAIGGMRGFLVIIDVDDAHGVTVDYYFGLFVEVIEIDLFVFIVDVP